MNATLTSYAVNGRHLQMEKLHICKGCKKKVSITKKIFGIKTRGIIKYLVS